jgi:hypothetical protein
MMHGMIERISVVGWFSAWGAILVPFVVTVMLGSNSRWLLGRGAAFTTTGGLPGPHE